MTTLDYLAQFESDDAELVPDILPAHARLSLAGAASDFIWLLERAASVCPAPDKEVVSGTAYALLEGVPATDSSLPYAQVTASDGEQTISVRGSARVLMPGQVLLPPKKILEVLKNVPTPETRIEVVGQTCTIRSGRAVWNIQVPTGDTLALLTQAEGIPTHEVPTGPFKAALRTARRAASASNGRPALGQLEIRDGYITGCDGGRVHRVHLGEGMPEDLTLSIPIKVADQLIVALSYSMEPKFEIGANDYTIVFRIGNDSLIAQRMLVPFPENITSLLLAPALTNTDHLTVDREALLRVVKRVRINSDPDYSFIFLTAQPGRKGEWTLAVSARDRIGNAAQEVLECTFTGSGKARELCLNHRYLADLLTGYDQEQVTFKVGLDTKSQKHPLLVEDREQGFQGLVQQMRAEHLT